MSGSPLGPPTGARILHLALALALVLVVGPAAASAALPAPGALPGGPVTSPAAPAARQGRWIPPVQPVVITSGFDPPAQPWLPGHRGIDLRTRPGAPVRAAGSGRVVYAAALAGRGVLVIDHGALRTTYEPVEAGVSVGQRVDAGQRVGTVGTGTGHCGNGSCLHLGLRRGRVYLDPRLLLAHGRAVLRPW